MTIEERRRVFVPHIDEDPQRLLAWLEALESACLLDAMSGEPRWKESAHALEALRTQLSQLWQKG